LPCVVEAEEASQEATVPDERVEGCQERHAGALQPPFGGRLGLSRRQPRDLAGEHVPAPADALDGHGHEFARGDELVAQAREHLGSRAMVGAATRLPRDAVPELRLAALAEQAMGAVAREQLVALL